MRINLGAVVRRTVVAVAGSAAVVVPVAASAPAAEAAGSVRSALSLSAPSAAPYGAKVTLSGVLWRYQTTTKIAGANVTLQRANKGNANWTSVTAVSTSSTGTYAFSVTQGLAYDYRTVYAGNATYTSAVSPVRYPVVMQRVFLDSVKTVNYQIGVLRATGRLYPASGARVYLQRYNPNTKAWTSIGSKVASGSSVTVDATVGGSTGQYRLYAPMTYPYGAGYSAAKTFSHYVWRGLFKKPVIADGGTNNPVFEVVTADADRYSAAAYADAGGSVWADVNTYACTRADVAILNFAREQLGAKITRAGTTIASATLGGANTATGMEILSVVTGGATELRIELTDIGAGDSLDARIFSRALCAS